jgi:alpha-tubulin suppressor-like RCC1 family protein
VGSAVDWEVASSFRSHNLAIKADGGLWAWGINGVGQVGDGTIVNRNLPAQVGEGTDWAAAACGTDHSLALMGDGSLWTWGNNDDGQLGLGAGAADQHRPVKLGDGWRVPAR